MGRKSSIDKLPKAVRKHIEKRFRENQMTLDELIDDLRAHFPSEKQPSRSALGRKKVGFEEMARSMREIDAAATALVGELGEHQDKSGALLAQAVTTLATNAAFNRLEPNGEPIDIDEVLKLARAARAAQETRTLSLKERQALKREALEQAAAAAEQTAKQMGLSDVGVQALRDAIKSQL